MSSSVVNGKLVRFSPSLISAFDPTSPFGCEIKGFLSYVEGVKEPQTSNQDLGIELHALNEAFLLGAPAPKTSAIALQLFKLGEKTLVSLIPRLVAVEKPVTGFIDGVQISARSKCDVVLTDGIWDHKTSSNVSKYGKTPGGLAKDDQLSVYAHLLLTGMDAELTHGYYQTKEHLRFEPISVKRSAKQILDHIDNVTIKKLRRIKEIVALKSPESLPPNKKACFMCGVKQHCPDYNKLSKESESLVSFFTRKPASSAAPAASLLAEGLHASVPEATEGCELCHTQQPKNSMKLYPLQGGVGLVCGDAGACMLRRAPAILPPDAPKSDPALAADPVEGFTVTLRPEAEVRAELAAAEAAPTPPVQMMQLNYPELKVTEEPVKRGRGRPKGSVNKPKDTYNAAAATTAFIEEINMPSSKYTVKSMTVTYGLNVPIGTGPDSKFNRFRFELTQEAAIDHGDGDSAYNALLNDIKAKVSAAIAEIQDAAKGGK